MVRKDLIIENFHDLGYDVDDDVAEKCVELCIRYNLDEAALVETWMAYSVTNAEDMKPTINSFLLMEKKMLCKSSRTPVSSKKQVPVPVSHYKDTGTVGEAWEMNYAVSYGTSKSPSEDIVSGSELTTPTQNRLSAKNDICKFAVHSPRSLFSPASFSPVIALPSKKYSERTNSGEIVCRFGKNESSDCWQAVTYSPQNVSLSSDFSHIPFNARFMFENIASKISESRKLAETICMDIVENNELKFPFEANRMSMETVTFAGRVLCDSNGKLNTSSILLESFLSNKMSENVQLQINNVSEYSLFPGQILVVEGRNPTGTKIIAEKVYADVKLPMCPAPKQFLEPREPLQIVVAAGPYTLSDTLSYQPWQDLSDYIIKMKPHVLILIGPIFDSLHPLIESVNESFSALYERQLLHLLDRLQDSKTHTKVAVVSSRREAAQLDVFPTRILRSSKLNRANLLLAPDPCILNINGFHIGITSVDVLMHLGKEELFCSTSGPGLDRLGRLASHLLQQKNFYPLMPPAEEMSIDVGLLLEHAVLPYKPHMMILPSELKYFIKNLNGCIVVNPEKLGRGQVGGTFARIEVNAASDGGVWDPEMHVSVQIVKI